MLTTRALGGADLQRRLQRHPVQAVEDDVDRPGRRQQAGGQLLGALVGTQVDHGVRAELEQALERLRVARDADDSARTAAARRSGRRAGRPRRSPPGPAPSRLARRPALSIKGM